MFYKRCVFYFLIISLFLAVSAANAQTATYTEWANVGLNAQVSYTSNPVYSFVATTTAATDICAGVGGGWYSHVMITWDQPFWLNGSVATPSNGIAMATTSSPLIIEVPSDLAKVGWTAIASSTGTTDATIKVIGIKR